MIRYYDPFQRVIPLRRLLDRMLEDMAQGTSYEEQGGQQARAPQAQTIPVNIFHTADQVVVVAPMPGVTPEDIEVQVTADSVFLRGEFRGPHQEDKDYLQREWSYGPYERRVQLPFGVDAERANASYNNGVLVLNLPKRDVTRAHRITLQTERSARGLQETRSGAIGSESEGAGGAGAAAASAGGAGTTAAGAGGAGTAAAGAGGSASDGGSEGAGSSAGASSSTGSRTRKKSAAG